MKYKKKALCSMLLISAMVFASCSGSDDNDNVVIKGEEVIRISIPDSTSQSGESQETPEETSTSESTNDAPENLIISQLNNRHAFGTRSETYGLIPEDYRTILDKAMYVLVGDIGPEEVIGGGFDGLYEARKSIKDREELLANTGYVIADFDGNGVDELLFFVMSGAEDTQKAFRVTTIYTRLNNSVPSLILAQGKRENYYMLPDGKIYYTGTQDATHHSVGLFEFTANGTRIDPVELYFTDYVDTLEDGSPDTLGEYGWFRSYDGKLTCDTSHEYDYMGADFDPAIKADMICFTPNQYCLFNNLRHRYEIVDKTVDVDDIKDLCKERGGHLVNMGDDYEKGVITGLLACKEYEDRVFCIGDKIYVRVVEKEGRYILEEVNEEVKETGYICEFDY